MRSVIRMAFALAALALASGSAAAQQIYAGELESIKDTTLANCGQTLGEHQFFLYRPKGAGALPAGIFVGFPGLTAYVQSTDASGEFFTDGTQGTMSGTILFGSQGPINVAQATMRGARYTLKIDATDPDMIKITKMTLRFKIRETGQVCNFIWNGVMTPALMPAP